jgi:N-acetylated-alpha-linked acidic dipeptidase
VLPISYEDALPLLRNIGGPVVPDAWKGALPVTYHVGPGPAVVRVALQFDWQTRPIYNVIARIAGRRYPDQWLLYGNHHDAWVNGAEDPISGIVAQGETARAFGKLLQSGWRPERSIMFAAWDAEEWGLLGSTEWVEKYLPQLRSNGVVYVNGDSNSRGWIFAGGSHSLQSAVSEVARDIFDSDKKMTVLAAWLQRRARGQRDAVPGAPADSTRADSTLIIDALGSGSDYTAFLDHAAIPSLHISYGGEASTGSYHSIYDTFDFYTRFLDSTFVYGVLEAQTIGTFLLRMADAPVLPFEFTKAVSTYRRYVDEIERETKKNDHVKLLNMGVIRDALDRVDRAAQGYEAVAARISTVPSARLRARTAQLRQLNQLLYQSEQLLSDSAGLPGRSWYRHLIYAPGFFTGYGVKTMPGVREAVEDVPDLAVARREATRITNALDRYAQQIERARVLLEQVLN